VTEADLTAADHIVAVKEAEHRHRFEAKFPAWRDRIEYWQVHDLDCAEPANALPHLEREVRNLFERLTAQQRLSA
jgi:protein-tyrosine phosphatase